MTKLHRRIIYIVFILIFLIAAPTVILYTSGYRYNFQKARVQKTGIMMLSSVPRGAEIWLNGKQVDKKTTPARLEYILPGDYEIQFKKSDYHDWQKKLPVYENNTTFAEKVVLWKQSQPQIMSASTSNSWLLTSDKRQAAMLAASNTLVLLEVGGDLTDFLMANEAGLRDSFDFKDYNQVNILDWSPDNKKILLSATGKADYYLVFNTLNKQLQKISGQFKIIDWGENSDLLYGADKLGFWQIDPIAGQQKMIFKSFLPDDFLIADGKIFYLENQTLWEKNLVNGRNGVVTSPVKCDHCHLTKKIGNRFVLQGRQTQKLLIIDAANRKNDMENSAKNLYWLSSDSLLFYNDWEMYIYDLHKKDPELITRLGQPIKSALWHPKGKHLIFAAGNKINIIELDNRELRNVIDLADNAEVKDLATSRDGKILYFSGKVNGTEGVYKLVLQ